ncbi:unnamed protein product [Clavelina lepadiformis]|uniref:Uncharacterized protein n=1 Tax=Clavelina lepadiformis TaxID=159417 RepID=A0ABP0G1D5_CLALP
MENGVCLLLAIEVFIKEKRFGGMILREVLTAAGEFAESAALKAGELMIPTQAELEKHGPRLLVRMTGIPTTEH